MSEERNDNPDRLETLLGEWGAETAAAEQKLPPAPNPHRHRPLPWMWRVAVPAAAVLLIGMLTIWGPLRGLTRHAEPQELAVKDAAEAETVERLDAELDELRDEHNEEVGQLRAKIVTLQQERDELALKAREATSRVAELEDANADYRQQVAGAGDAARRLSRFENETTALQGRLNRLQMQLAEQVRHGELTAERMEQLDRDRQRLLANLRQLYISTVAPGEQGVTAAKLAARKSQLLRRLGVLRSGGLTAEAQAATDKAESLLLRLAMLDEQDTSAIGEWIAAVETSDVIQEIDEALLAGPSPAMARWLVETRVIFAEATHVS